MNIVLSSSIGAPEGANEGPNEGTPPKTVIGVKTTPFENAFWVDDELSAIEADIKNALKSPFETELTRFETTESYRVWGDLPLVGTFNCVVASIS